MAQFGGKRGQAAESDIVQRGGEKVADLTAQTGAAQGAKFGAIGGAVGGTLGEVGQAMTEERRTRQAQAFQEKQMGAEMQFQQGMQREKFLGESAIKGQEEQAAQSRLQQELQARAQEHKEQREFEAASEGKVTYDKTAGKYVPSPLAMQQRQAELGYTRAKGMDLMSETAYRSEKLKTELAIARDKVGVERQEEERKAVEGMTKHMEVLADYELKARVAAAKGENMPNPMTKKMSGPDELTQFADQLQTIRNKQAFEIASQTGDVSHIVSNSKEQRIMQNRWLPLARRILENSPIMNEMATGRGLTWANRQVNKLAAQLTMAEVSDPDIAAAMAKAMMGSYGQPGQSAGGAAGQPGGGQPTGPGSQPGGISIPR